MIIRIVRRCLLRSHYRNILHRQCCQKYHKSPYNVDIPNISITEYILKDINKYRKFTALINGITGQETTFDQLESEIISTATGFKNIGLQKNDVVCLYGTNRPEFAHVFCGVTANGAILTIANSQLTADELATQLCDTSTKFIVTTPDCVTKAINAKVKVPSIKEIIVIGYSEFHRNFSDLIETKTNQFPDVNINPDTDTALVPYSSGTTGLPKGVLLTHKNLVAELCQLRHPTIIPFVSGEEKSISCLPMVHIAGLMIGMLNPMSQGAATVVLPRFEAESYLKAIQNFRGTFSLIAPPLVNFLAKDPMVSKYDLSTLHTPYSGAAPLSKTLTEQMVHRLKLQGVRQGYGMSETSGAIFTDPVGCYKYGSIGKPVPNTISKLVDIETGETITKAFESGEIWACGPQITKGYLNNEEATRRSITEEGWIKTGDIAYYDDDGHYFVVDRLKDIIKYKGYQISPTYLESILLSHEAVLEAAVIGVPADVFGEVPKAYVVLKSHAEATEIQKYINERVSPYKKLRGGLEIVDEIPKLPSGKILRRKLPQTDNGKENLKINY
ncbi:probable 4-coumarate--CoA ligase 1 [Mytilus trossulus]|uniref:probable 4-coumarate--CoA ligase 1 n=1 Tax=Mytilus trossulus TaxID=6551 RepID=UPI0030077E09